VNLTVLAAGAWGTALAIAFSERHRVTLWTHEAEAAADMLARRENIRYLPGHRLPDGIRIASDFNAAVADAELLIVATPIAGLRPVAQMVSDAGVRVPLLWVCKGFEAGSGLLPHQVVQEVVGDSMIYGVLSGPSFAAEVADGKPTAVVVATGEAESAGRLARELHCGRLRIYANDDLVGVEVGGAVKNVLAIAAGVCDGLGLGLNSRAALITRGLAEIARLGQALGGRRETFMGLAGLGDLLLTCTGDLSRNRRVGLGLAEGKPLAQILEELGHVAEGVYTANEVDRLARRLGVEMPISAAVTALLEGRMSAPEAVDRLMARDPREETA
jgi:glycerol-3-phosphate dehydrogenase (NAD(P)+)